MRHESAFLKDIVSACRKIEAIVATTNEASFLADEILPAAVLHHLAVIGEAISRLSPELRSRHPEVPWHQIVAVRHRVVHAYFDLDWQILWDTAEEEIAPLRCQVLDILQREFSPSDLS
ncbi:MAG: HepT-like ribonuclease domain-containing protein [Candidatus Solibacter sp.]